jgi:predicted DNA-binding protein YlxM (UPF0122 family)
MIYFNTGKVEGYNVLPDHSFGREKISSRRAVYMIVWYLANTNTFREVADRFNVSKSSAHRVISTIVSYLMREASKYIYWPNQNGRKIIKNGFKNSQGIGKAL